MIVLDTDYMSLLQWSKGTNRVPVLQRVRSLPAESLATTIVTYEEQTRGWMAIKAKARTVTEGDRGILQVEDWTLPSET